MSTTLKVVEREYLSAFDEVTINTDHKVEYSEDSGLVAAYPENADETTFNVSVFSVDDQTVDIPESTTVLEIDGNSVVALVPAEVFDQ